MTIRSLRRSVLVMMALTVVLTIVVCIYFLTSPITIHGDGFVYVPRGASVLAAVDSLERKAKLPSTVLARLTARALSDVAGKQVQAGWFKLDSSMSLLDAVTAIVGGRYRSTIRVTIPEGLTIREIAALLHSKADVDSAAFVNWAMSDSTALRYGAQGATMEGYLMPDTYDVHWRSDASDIGDRMARHFDDVWHRHCEGLLTSSGRNRHDVITLASIVQAEAAVIDEMPRIAGVYVNRLRQNMRLEADPTVQYGLGVRRRLLYGDLDDEHAYNTYRVFGLPPGPINNPGLAALRATLSPEDHDDFFFVARGDGSGLHYFAATAHEHQRNVALYRKRRQGLR